MKSILDAVVFVRAPLFGAIILFLIAQNVAAAGIIPCDGSTSSPCDFDALIVLAGNIIQFLIVAVALPLAAISFAWAGIKLMTARGNENTIREAKAIFWYVLIGLIVVLAAWLLVYAILDGLGLKAGFWLLTGGP